MANVKKITHLHGLSGLTLYCIIRRDADDYLLNDADGAFAEAPVDFYIAMTEDSVLKGLYEKSESRAAWDNGDYTIIVCLQNGGSPAIASDTIVGGSVLQIVSDAEFNEATSVASARSEIAAVKTVVDTIQADTDLLDDAIGGLADIHTDIASARSEIATVDGHVSDVFDDVGDLQSSVDDILADTNELQLEFVDGGRLDLLIDSILADTGELQTDWVNGGRLDLLIDQILADTNELQLDWANGGRLDLLLDQTLADTNELQIDNVDGGRTDLLIDSIITKVDAVATATVGLGAITWAYTLTDSVTALPIEGAEVWVTSDIAGLHMIAHGYTNASGVVTFFLDAGPNYFWRQHGGYTFINPDTEVVA